MTKFDSRLERAWWMLRIGLGLGPLLAGVDKFFNFLADWPSYLSPFALRILPFSGPTVMHIVGVIEMIVGLAILTKWTRLGSVGIALELLTTGTHFDIAVRDLLIALSALVLALLTEVRAEQSQAGSLSAGRAA